MVYFNNNASYIDHQNKKLHHFKNFEKKNWADKLFWQVRVLAFHDFILRSKCINEVPVLVSRGATNIYIITFFS